MFLIPLLAQAAPAAPEVAEKTVAQPGVMSLLWEADPVVKLTLLILITFSVCCWAIIFYKFKQIRQAQSQSQNFWNIFASSSLADIGKHPQGRQGPLYEIYNAGLQALQHLRKKSSGSITPALEQKLAQAREEEVYKLEQFTPFLATAASASPFIGLFGTVWGILTAFWQIGKAGSSSLATVGPAISEALIATAIGLATAIPAYVTYNYFVYRIKVIVKMMNLFCDDLVLRIEEEN